MNSRLTPDQIVAILEEAGYQALYVGGYVRDRLLGLQPEDADIATSASPEQVIELFCDRAEVKQQGKHFGVVVVDRIEVAMFRGESYPIPGKPDVFPAHDFAEDAARRDFTINAMAMNRSGQIIDPVDGRDDLRVGLIRAVGDPDTRFREDPTRLLRAATFAARLGFQIEPETATAIRRNAHLLETLPVERVQKELIKMLDRHVLHRGLMLLWELGLIAHVFPKWSAASEVGCYERCFAAITAVAEAERLVAPRAVVLAAMAAGCSTDILTSAECAERLRTLIVRLGFGRPLGKRVENLVRLSARLDELGDEPHALLTWLRQVASACRNVTEMRSLVEDLWQIRLATRGAGRQQGGAAPAPTEEKLRRRVVDAMLEQVPWYPSDAGIDGSALGLKGAAVGRRVTELLAQAQAEAVTKLKLKRG